MTQNIEPVFFFLSLFFMVKYRCRTWIANTKRFDLLDKINVHDERICQQHFEPIMFLNESQNRLQQYAVPSLFLTSKPPPVQPPPFQRSSLNDLMINGVSGADHLFNVSTYNKPDHNYQIIFG